MKNTNDKETSFISFLAGKSRRNLLILPALGFAAFLSMFCGMHLYDRALGLACSVRENTRNVAELREETEKLQKAVAALAEERTAWNPGLPPLSALPSPMADRRSQSVRPSPLPPSLTETDEKDGADTPVFVLSAEKAETLTRTNVRMEAGSDFVLSDGAVQTAASGQFVLASGE